MVDQILQMATQNGVSGTVLKLSLAAVGTSRARRRHRFHPCTRRRSMRSREVTSTVLSLRMSRR
ncbi:hypothetical protein [Nesterenkonia pannonica]|uniref:hypothetical protein n=1 Tax=Nesterenkonia pannonica TaxID=1548602 RepID=UPI002164BDEB|nr:hypothetical protein [Nesterenkonia pannonica]